MSTSVTAPVTAAASTFTGVSNYASSLQQVLTRAVSIASLPLTLLQNGLTTLDSQQTALQGLDTSFSSLEESIGSIQSAVSSGLLSASVADPSIASATLQSGATAGTYSLEVDNLGAYSTALSVAGSTAVTDPTTEGISSSTTLNLTLSAGGTPIVITPASSDLQDLASAINSQAGGQVQATLVNVGSTSSPDYRLSLQSSTLTADTIDLTDSSGNDLISSATGGAPASYIVDGAPSISSDTRTITLSPGLTVNLLGQSTLGDPTTITVQTDPSTLASAFSSFATAYNSASSAVAAQQGQGAGALSGDSMLLTLSNVLGQLGTYSNGSPSNSLANFGITLDESGVLSVDTSTFTSAAAANFSGLLSTLGNSTSGGFLQTATNLLSSVEDAATGALTTEEASVATQITNQQTQITNEKATVAQLQTNLTAQISAADSSIAELESQVSYVTGLFAQYTGATNTQTNGLSTL
jgi:flagellar hook-associated protein 2